MRNFLTVVLVAPQYQKVQHSRERLLPGLAKPSTGRTGIRENGYITMVSSMIINNIQPADVKQNVAIKTTSFQSIELVLTQRME